MLFSSIRHVVPLSDGDSRLAMPAVKGRGVRDALIETSTTWEFKCGLRGNLNTVRHCYNESAKIVESYKPNEPTNLTEIGPALDMDGRMPRTSLRYT